MMNFIETGLAGAWQIELDRLEDDRGFFARSFCEREFAAHGLSSHFVQCNVSFNHKAGTLRGMHWQEPPHAEAKLVRCTSGALFDVIVDLRPSSPTYLHPFGIELSSENRTMLFIPAGFAHGFLTLRDATEIFYQMSDFHTPNAARGFRWNDPRIGIQWPREPNVISQRDQELPLFGETA
jgi:dTDP-4-dehydrorhamnose 3,5-epimerase